MKYKKFLTFFAVATIVLSVFTACGQVKDECPGCGEIKPLYIMKYDSSITDDGDDIACKECMDNLQQFVDEMKELGMDIEYTIEKYTGK